MAFDIAGAQQLGQPVSSFLQGRSLRLAEEGQRQRSALAVAADSRAEDEHATNMKLADIKFGEQKAKQVLAAAEQVLAKKDGRKAYVEQAHPEFVKEFEAKGGDWKDVDDNDVAEYATAVRDHAASELGITPGKGEDFTLSPGQERWEGGKKIASVPLKPDAMTPYQQEQLKLEKEKLAFEKSKPSPGEKPPMGYRYAADGNLEFIPGGPADPATASNSRTLKPIPSAAAQGIVGNRSSLSQIERALKAVRDNPDAFGAHNVLPDAITQRLDGKEFSGGVDARAKVADIGSLKIHDRSGAAVTAAEFPRLKPFIPQMTDKPEVVKTKLENFKANLQAMNDEAESFYSTDAGYRPISEGKGGKGGGGKGPTVGMVQDGYRYKGGNPADPHSWEPAK